VRDEKVIHLIGNPEGIRVLGRPLNDTKISEKDSAKQSYVANITLF
jgi:hypothetical protein